MCSDRNNSPTPPPPPSISRKRELVVSKFGFALSCALVFGNLSSLSNLGKTSFLLGTWAFHREAHQHHASAMLPSLHSGSRVPFVHIFRFWREKDRPRSFRDTVSFLNDSLTGMFGQVLITFRILADFSIVMCTPIRCKRNTTHFPLDVLPFVLAKSVRQV